MGGFGLVIVKFGIKQSYLLFRRINHLQQRYITGNAENKFINRGGGNNRNSQLQFGNYLTAFNLGIRRNRIQNKHGRQTVKLGNPVVGSNENTVGIRHNAAKSVFVNGKGGILPAEFGGNYSQHRLIIQIVLAHLGTENALYTGQFKLNNVFIIKNVPFFQNHAVEPHRLKQTDAFGLIYVIFLIFHDEALLVLLLFF